ncbi:MAG TPA: hypothetical protein VJG90_00630 [Candidatus Nanoarchaeia archaeon]|nr:hypothetical protein [Candidatus Nanoarchaeia archaeon]
MIADSSTLIIFSRTNRLDLLLKVFEKIEITEGVYREACLDGLRVNAPDALRIKDWVDQSMISKHTLKKPEVARHLRTMYPALGIGESETIAFAQEKNEHTLLLDDRLARQVAQLHSLKPFGSLRVLALAFKKDFLNEKELKNLIRLLLANKFRLSAEVIMEFWELIERMKKGETNSE